MYERNAIVIDRYFSELLGYGDKSNLKNNYANYNELVKKLEKYQESSRVEDEIMNEFEIIANQIKEIQKAQELLYRKSLKFEENRKDLFDVLDEDAESLRKKFEKVENDITKNQEEVKENSEKFINEIAEFNEKSVSRVQCGRERRIAESEYQKQLNETITNFQAIDQEKITTAKEFYKKDNNEMITEISEKMIRNGEKEKVPFNRKAIEKAVQIETELEEKIVEILCISYDRTLRLLAEIKSDNIKLEKHKKLVKDNESKLRFLNAIEEYIILFLDNERLNVVGGEKEHKKLMDKACKNVEKDMVEIKNLYELILKEISGKSTKKAFKEMYKPEYLLKLEDEEREFEKDVSKLNMIGTIIYPDYWRVDGMKKIFDAFRTILTENYEKDLTEYEPFTTNIEDVYKFEEEELVKEEKSELDKFYIDDMWSEDDFDEDDYDEEEKEEFKDLENDEEEHDLEDESNEDSDDSTEFDYDDIDFEDEEDDENESADDDSEDEDTDDDFDFDFGDDDELDDGEEDYDDDKQDYIEEDSDEDYVDEKDKEIDEILGFFDNDYNYSGSNESDLEDDDNEDEDFGLDLDFGYEDFNKELEEDEKPLSLRKVNKKQESPKKASKRKNKKNDFDVYDDVKEGINKVDKKSKKSFFKKR